MYQSATPIVTSDQSQRPMKTAGEWAASWDPIGDREMTIPCQQETATKEKYYPGWNRIKEGEIQLSKAQLNTSSRIPEILEQLKQEYESLVRHLVQGQVGELNRMQQAFLDLEHQHSKMKQKYEEEIAHLRQQLELKDISRKNGESYDYGSAISSALFNGANGSAPLASKVSPPTPVGRSLAGSNGANLMRSPGSGVSSPRDVPMSPGVGGVATAIRSPSHSLSAVGAGGSGGPGPVSQSSPLSPPREALRAPFPADIPQASADPPANALQKNAAGEWHIVFNPNVQVAIDADLFSTLQHDSVVCSVRFSRSGEYLATGSNRRAQVFRVSNGSRVANLSGDLLEARGASKEGDLYIRSVCFSGDETQLIAGAEDKTIKIWDIHNKKLVNTLYGHEMDIYALACSGDDRYIVSGSGDRTVKVWDRKSGQVWFTLGNDEVGPKDGVSSVAISPDSRYIAAGSLDQIVRIWDAETGYFLQRFEGHSDSVYAVAFSPDGRSLVSGSLDKQLKIWELKGTRSSRSRCRSTLVGHRDYVLSVAFSPDGQWLVSGSKDRCIRFWDPRTSVTYMMLQGHKNSVISIAVSPTAPYFASGSGDECARIWRYNSRLHY